MSKLTSKNHNYSWKTQSCKKFIVFKNNKVLPNLYRHNKQITLTQTLKTLITNNILKRKYLRKTQIKNALTRTF